MMMCDHVRQVREVPARGGEIQREQALLATEEQALVEAADVEVRRAPEHARAGEEAEHGYAGQSGWPRQRARRHRAARRVLPILGAHEDARRDHGERRVPVEGVRRARERVRCPPRVVVRQRDVRGPQVLDADVASRRTDVAAQPDDVEVREAAREPRGGAVGGVVVDHDDRRARRQCAQPLHRARHLDVAIVGEDGDADAWIAGAHVSLQYRSGSSASA